jgi:hypothetical protein
MTDGAPDDTLPYHRHPFDWIALECISSDRSTSDSSRTM